MTSPHNPTASAAGRTPALPVSQALLIGGATALVLFVIGLASTVFSSLSYISVYRTIPNALQTIVVQTSWSFWFAVAMGLGVFLSVRFIAPVSASQSLMTVLVKSILAALVGGAIFAICAVFVSIISSVGFGSPIFGNSFPAIDGLSDAATGALSRFVSAISGTITAIPAVALVIVVWWARGRGATRLPVA